jgi:hypothetical protein
MIMPALSLALPAVNLQGVVAQKVAEAVRLLVSMRDQQTKAPVPHPQLARL